jgi:secreted Zn-dependent insulinase-like peptidase
MKISSQFMTTLIGNALGDVSYKNIRCSNGIHILAVDDTHRPEHLSLTTSMGASQRMSWV